MPLRSQAVLVPCALVHLALCAGAHPQSPPYSEVDNTVELPPFTGSITRTCTGDVDGDFTADVALLAGGRVFVGLDISAHENLVEVEDMDQAIDLAMMPKSSGEAGCDLALTRANGVFVVGCQGAVQAQDPWVIEHVLAPDSSLQGASLVRSADLDKNGRSDLVVVLANQKTVRVLLRQIDGTWNTSLAPFTLPTNVSEIVGLQYDMDAPLELAIQTAGSARVHELDGTFVAMARNATSGAPAAMAVMPVPGSTRSRVAYLATATTGAYELHLLEYLIGLESLNVGNLVPRALLAGDYDGDGDHDLLVDHGGSGSVTLLESNESTLVGCGSNPDHHFSCQLPQQLLLHVAPQDSVMQPISWSDLDNDGSPDLLVPSSDTSSGARKVEFRPKVPAPEAPGDPGVTEEEHPVFLAAEWANPNLQATVAPQLRLFVADVWGNDNLDYLQVTVWRKQNPQGSQPPGTETIGRFNGFYRRSLIPYNPTTGYQLTLPDTTVTGTGANHTPFQQIDTTLAASNTDTTLYFVEVRSVDLDGNNQVVEARRKQVIGLALNLPATGTSEDYLLGIPDGWGVSIPREFYAAGFINQETYKIGGLVPLPNVPAFVPGFLVYTEPVIIPGP
jgi:hypothetical protein